MRFKPGQKVVCVNARNENPLVLSPKFNEVVTIHGPGFHGTVKEPIVRIEEYLHTKIGNKQGFYEKQFEPLPDDSFLDELRNVTHNKTEILC